MEINNPKISVILPAYNAEKYLREAIDSILSQTFSDFELIVLNDGSTDSTEDIILSYDDTRVRYVKNETNLKLIKTLNKGIDLALGKYIARMDADDISMPERLYEEYKFMEEHPEAGACSSLVYYLKGGKIKKGNYYPSFTPDGCRFCAMFRTPLSHPASFFRADVLKRYKYREEDYALHIEAMVLWGQLAADNVDMHVLPKRLLVYRDNDTSICHSYTDLMMRHQIDQVSKMLVKLLGIEPRTDTLKLIYNGSSASTADYQSAIALINNAYNKYVTTNDCHGNEKDINRARRILNRKTYVYWFKSAGILSKIGVLSRFLWNELCISLM